nr:phosphopantetheine-binding protein [Streptomyces sp. SID8352]
MVSGATDGMLSAEELLASTEPLAALGVGSLALLRLADGLEEEFGILVDLGDPALHTGGLDGLTAHVERLTSAGAP